MPSPVDFLVPLRLALDTRSSQPYHLSGEDMCDAYFIGVLLVALAFQGTLASIYWGSDR